MRIDLTLTGVDTFELAMTHLGNPAINFMKAGTLEGSGYSRRSIAADSPSDPAHANGWQEGDNGGFGFTAWSMYGTANSAIQHTMDSSSPYTQLGPTMTLIPATLLYSFNAPCA